MCGGTLEIAPNQSTAVCDYCGTNQTVPNLDDERRANLYDRANHFRRNNEFDKAMSIYDNILNENPADAEAYWSLVLCRYGIEYVEDPGTKQRVPTVNRAQFTSIFNDDNYRSAINLADLYQKAIYESEAEKINEIQKGILAISQKEEPFDVFICYKESDHNGRRSQDSVLAQELYFQLKNEGYKVFFSRITLEDKLGTAYEPYIFAALNSAKVMVVMGTKPEHFNSVWVKNEWSRYLALVKSSKGKKMLIPAFRDMDPYDLPEEFSHLQAQDMSKLGFMQDLVRGIKKIISKDAPRFTEKETVAVNQNAAAPVAPLLERMFMFLEDSDWKSADEYAEKVLDQDPKNGTAYLGKLMANIQVNNRDQLKNASLPFDENANYQKIQRFGDNRLKQEMSDCTVSIRKRIEKERQEAEAAAILAAYNRAINAMNSSVTESDFKMVSEMFDALKGYENADKLAEECRKKTYLKHMEHQYTVCSRLMQAAENMAQTGRYGVAIKQYREVLVKWREISEWQDADKQIALCEEQIHDLSLDQKYYAAKSVQNQWFIDNKSGKVSFSTQINTLAKAIEMYREIRDWRDADNRLRECEATIAQIKETEHQLQLAKEEQHRKAVLRRKRIFKIFGIVCGAVAALIIALIILIMVI